MYEYAWLVMNFFAAAAAACVNNIFFPYIYTEYGSHTFIIYLPHVAGMKNSHNADFTLVLLKIFDVHLVFFGTKPRSLIFLPCIPYGTVSAMMLFKHDSFYIKIIIDD